MQQNVSERTRRVNDRKWRFNLAPWMSVKSQSNGSLMCRQVLCQLGCNLAPHEHVAFIVKAWITVDVLLHINRWTGGLLQDRRPQSLRLSLLESPGRARIGIGRNGSGERGRPKPQATECWNQTGAPMHSSSWNRLEHERKNWLNLLIWLATLGRAISDPVGSEWMAVE